MLSAYPRYTRRMQEVGGRLALRHAQGKVVKPNYLAGRKLDA
jgi:hypothetical protein